MAPHMAQAASSAPGAPTIGKATAGSAQASLLFTAPSSNGGAAITGYSASCVTGTTSTTTVTGTGTSSPLVVKDLVNGSVYLCSVKAVNSVGPGRASAGVVVTPAAVPGAPTIASASAASARATLTFQAPSSTGGMAITGYTASCATGTANALTASGSSSPITVAGLANGSTYVCSVAAKNAVGTGASSATVSVITPAAAVSKPGSAVVTGLTAGTGQISVAFIAGTGGTASSYTATCSSTSASKTSTGSSSPIVVTGLTAGANYSCTVKATNAGGTSAVSNALSSAPSAASTAVTYSTPANFAAVVAKSYTPTTTLTALATSGTVTNRGRYMISDAATASTSSNYLAIGDTYSASAGYAVTSGTLSSASTYNHYLTKTIQLVEYPANSGYYRLDSHLHPNNSIDVDSTDASKLKFRNNFGKAATTYGYVNFSYSPSTHLLRAVSRYTYSYSATTYAATYTLSSTYTDKYVSYSNGVYSLSSTGTPLYLYASPLNLGIPSFIDPMATSFVTQGPASFLNKIPSTSAWEAQIAKDVNTSYSSQVSATGTNATTKANADAALALIKTTVEGNSGTLRYAPALYTAFRDGLLANKLVSDSISDGTPGQNTVPYVYFTNEKDSAGTYHPFMVVINYGNQASPNGLKDVPSPPCSGTCGTAVTRFSNLENYITVIPMRDYGLVTAVTDNATLTTNLWSDVSGKVGSSTLTKNVYTYADVADNGLLIDGSVMFPAFNNTLVPSHLRGELSASGCHVGQGGGGPHCHADGYQSGQGLGLYNDSDYSDKTHPPIIGFGYDGVALFGQYRGTTDSAMLGYGTLDEFGGHNHDSIGYHYHAHTVVDYQPVGMSTSYKSTMHVLMKGAYIGKIDTVPYFRSRTVNSLNSNKYMGGTVK